MTFNSTTAMFTNTTGTIIPVLIQKLRQNCLVKPPQSINQFLTTYTWLQFSPFLSALLLAARIYQFTQQWIHFKPPNLLLPLRPAVPVAYPEIFFGGGGSTISVEDRGQRGRGCGGGSPLVRGSGGSCNLVQEISFHIVTFS